MASAISVVRLSLLLMTDVQRWVASSISLSLGNSITSGETLQFSHSVSASRVFIPLDTSMTGWGATFKGRAVNGIWSAELAQVHINYLELMAVFLALKHFLPHLRGQHVLVKSTAVAHTHCGFTNWPRQ